MVIQSLSIKAVVPYILLTCQIHHHSGVTHGRREKSFAMASCSCWFHSKHHTASVCEPEFHNATIRTSYDVLCCKFLICSMLYPHHFIWCATFSHTEPCDIKVIQAEYVDSNFLLESKQLEYWFIKKLDGTHTFYWPKYNDTIQKYKVLQRHKK